tara:strand:- start:39 stop:1031 length:993 start_codon:yes stop_codon:yes gene_type:complete
MPQATVEEKLKILKAISPYLDQSELAELQKDLIKMEKERTSIGRTYPAEKYRLSKTPGTGEGVEYWQTPWPGHPKYTGDDEDKVQISGEEYYQLQEEQKSHKTIRADYDKRRSALEQKIKDVQERQAKAPADSAAPVAPAETKTSNFKSRMEEKNLKFKSKMEEVAKKRIEQQKLKQQSQYTSKMTKRLPAMKQALADLEQQKKDATVASTTPPETQAQTPTVVDPVVQAKVDPVASAKVDPVVKVAESGSDPLKIKKVVKKVTESEPAQKIKEKLVERKTSERRVVKNARRDLAKAEEELKAATTPKESMRAKEKIRRAKARLEKYLKK